MGRLPKTSQLYHLALWLLALMWSGCAAPRLTQEAITVLVQADDQTYTVTVPSGSTAGDAVRAAGLTVGDLDRLDPPDYTVLTDGAHVRLIRVTEDFEIQQEIIPYERQTITSETLPEGESRLVQPGKNGLREVTVRILYEDGVEVSRSRVKSVVIEEPVAEVVMVGRQPAFTPQEIPGQIAFLTGGNAWLLEGSTANRRLVVSTGDLDGRVFRLSPDGRWLLFTRRAGEDEEQINSLWVASTDPENPWELNLGVENVVHFADWSPDGGFSLAFSTVEPRSAAPGWQANNDLYLISFSTTGWVSPWRLALETNAGGIYGWWGTFFAWAPDARRLAYARPDGVGVLPLGEGALQSWMTQVPFQTNGDWAWVPALSWSPDGQVLYSVVHKGEREDSPRFDLIALIDEEGLPVPLVSDVGMFAYPSASPPQPHAWESGAYQIAYLQAIFPDQSETSRYRLMVMDRDGSNRRTLFPAEGQAGLEPQQVIWSPQVLPNGHFALAVIYQGDLWLVDAVTGEGTPLTAEGNVRRLDWK